MLFINRKGNLCGISNYLDEHLPACLQGRKYESQCYYNDNLLVCLSVWVPLCLSLCLCVDSQLFPNRDGGIFTKHSGIDYSTLLHILVKVSFRSGGCGFANWCVLVIWKTKHHRSLFTNQISVSIILTCYIKKAKCVCSAGD